MEPSKNSPNPEKFLREMGDLKPFLEANKIIQKEDHREKLVDLNGNAYPTMSRQQARQAGFKSAREANAQIKGRMDSQREHEYRASKIGEKVEEAIRKRHPFITRLANWLGWVWLYKLAGTSWEVRAEETEETVGSLINIYRFGKVKEIIHLVWENKDAA